LMTDRIVESCTSSLVQRLQRQKDKTLRHMVEAEATGHLPPTIEVTEQANATAGVASDV
jgi:hypothetical protein